MFHSVTGSLAGAIVGVAFWVFLTITAVAGMRYELRKRQLAMESLRAAIERGQPLEPGIVEQLLALHREPGGDRAQELEPNLHLGGIITVAVGVGLALAALPIGLQFPVARLPMLGVAALVVCIGAGLVIAARALRRRSASPAGSSDRVRDA